MTTSVKALCALTTALLYPTQGQAGTQLKPGLWEVRTQTILPGGMTLPDPSQLPPELTAELARRGISAQVGGGAANVGARICLSKEQAARGEVPQPADNRCRSTVPQKSGDTLNWRLVCADREGRSVNGQGFATIEAPDNFTGKIVLSVVDSLHGTITTQTRLQGRWLGECY